MTENKTHPFERATMFAFAIILGPMNFGGEIVGPGGNVHWRQILMGVVGTILWAYFLWTVITLA